MKKRVTYAIGAVAFAAATCAFALFGQSSAASYSKTDEAAVYDAVLASWFGKDTSHQLVDEHLSEAPSSKDPEFKECAKGLDFATSSPGSAKEQTLEGVQLKTKGIELVDGSHWKPVDPGQSIANGKSVESAVSEGFSHSLMSFSQIAFSRDGKDALVKFGMTCGSLCGSGSTMRLNKKATGWVIVARCSDWIS